MSRKREHEDSSAMSNKSPIFPISDPFYFNDAQTDYFHQVLGKARKQHRRGTGSVDAHPCKLQKPVSREEFKKSKKRKWWRNALRFLKWNTDRDPYSGFPANRRRIEPCYEAVSRPPVYGGELLTAVAPCRSSGPRSGPLAGTLSPTRKGRRGIPYLSLRELNGDHQRTSTSSFPIYLVT